MTPALSLRLGTLGLGLVLSLGACRQEAPSVPAAPSQAATPVSCLNDIGEPAAKRLVERCIMVSPATRPPCHVDNPCDMIQSEIDRGCDFFPANEKPAECAA